MAYNIVMPQLSDSMTEGKLISWKVKVGDEVKTGDTIAEVESDKAIMEVQTFHDGIVKELKIKEGESAPVGSIIAVIAEKDELKEENTSKTTTKDEKDKNSSKKTEESKPQEIKKSPKIEKTQKEISPPDNKKEQSVIDEIFFSSSQESKNLSYTIEGEASPKAKELAQKYKIDIATLQKEGKLPKPAHTQDVKEYILRKYFTPKALKMIKDYNIDISLFSLDKKYKEEDIKEYISSKNIPKIQKLSSNRIGVIKTVEEASKKPVYYIYDHIEAALLKEYESKNHTITVLLLKLIAEMMMRNEALRSTIGDDNTINIYPNASVSVAMANGENLYMPVFKNINLKSLDEIAQELEEMKDKVKNNKISIDDMQGSTFGISNLGMTGIEGFTAMINSKDSAIVAIGSEIDNKISTTFTFDHRIVNGLQGAKAVQTLKELAKDREIFKD